MGLLLSVLVVCVGVVELLDFCYNIRRNLTLVPDSRILPQVRNNYVKSLEGHKAVTNINSDNIPRIRLNRDCLSHEDVEIEVNKNVLQDRSRSSSPRRYLVTEKNQSSRSRSPSPRRFVVTEEPQGLQRSQHQNCVPEFLFLEKEIPEQSTNPSKRIILKGEETGIIPPLPLPKQFVVTEDVLSHIQANSTVKHNIEIYENFYEAESSNSIEVCEAGPSSSRYGNFDEVRTFQPSSARTEQLLQAEIDSPSRSRSPSPIPRRFADAHHRSPSPFPSFELMAPRNSICTELLDNPPVSVSEIDEELYRSRSSSPSNILVSPSNSNTVEYNTNKLLVTTPTGKRSQSPNPPVDNILSVPDSFRNRSKSESNKNDHQNGPTLRKTTSQYHLCDATDVLISQTGEQHELVVSQTSERTDEQFLNNLDGVKHESRKSRRNKRRKSGQSSIDKPGTSSHSDDVTMTQNGDSGNKKEPEAFWLIFSGEYTKAMNKDWHGQHFCCWQCDESLTGQRYVLRDEHPYCVACYESVFANACEKCSRIIGIDSKDLSYKDKHWHEACFLCTTCGESLVDKQFGSKGDRIYCGRCYDEQFASRCDGCHEIFRAGTKKMEYKTRQWHEKCFCCCVCKSPIGTQSFIPREQEIYCAGCYEEKFATRCIKCNKVITSGGVTYKNEPWHRECFTCTNCQKSLAGERFTSRDEKPYCAECFGELFAKRCFACNKPITGIGGTKFISFEDRHWHNDCFHCASCKTSLVGRGFITDQEDIICPECAKAKLM